MKKSAKIFAAIGVLLSIPLSAQIRIGAYSLASPSAPMLRASIGAGGFTPTFLGAVGGVAFDHKALPAVGFEPRSVILRYVAGNPDGQRVVAVIDGQAVRVNLYDWQLAPIVRFTQSKDTAVFTLFGQLDDRRQQEEVLENDGHVVNYNEAFVNTLMGLRMLQLDTLLAGSVNDDLAVDLPKDGDRYIVGSGERLPDVTQNRAALANYHAVVKSAIDDNAAEFRSYVISDKGRDIRFDVSQGVLRISGEPGYYFWRYYGDGPGVQESIQNRVSANIRTAKAAARLKEGVKFDERTWLIGQVRPIAGANLSFRGELELLSLPLPKLNELLEELRVGEALDQPAYRKVVELRELGEYVNSHIGMVRRINPNVWAAATTVMR